MPTSELRRRLESQFSESQRCWVYSAFVTQAGVDLILSSRTVFPADRLLVRCSVADVLAGACSLEAMKAALQAGMNIRISTALHVKLYVFDSVLFVGSANLTGKGLALVGYCNDELSAEGVPVEQDLEIAENLWSQGLVVDMQTLQLMSDFINEVSVNNSNEQLNWPDSILNEVRDLYCSDFPLGLSADKDRWGSSTKIESSIAYKWLLRAVTENGGSASFGYLSSDLHSAVFDDPAPYRREIKELLNNLLQFVEKYGCSDVLITKPNRSTVVFLRS